MARLKFVQSISEKFKALPKAKKLGALFALLVLAGGGGFFMTSGSKKVVHQEGHAPAQAEAQKGEHRDEHQSAAGDHSLAGHSEKDDSPADGQHKTGAHSVKVDPTGEHADQNGFADLFKKNLKNFIDKTEQVQAALDANERLKLENANLRRWAEALRFDCSTTEAQTQTHQSSAKLEQETGARVGRVLASISYRPPAHLLPQQLFTLAVTYLKGDEIEKAAVIMTFLTGLEDNDAYKTPRNFLMTASAWYRLDHYKLADFYFDKVLEFPESQDHVQYQAQARLWKALVAKRVNNYNDSQKWLRELVDYHPHSTEASWVNTKEGTSARLPASDQAGSGEAHEDANH